MSIEITPTTSWNEIRQDSTITQVVHPLYDNYITKEEFALEFKEILSDFNGQENYPDSYLGFYVEINPLNGSLKFKDEDSKADFIEYAISRGIIPPLKEVCEGEASNDRQERLENSEWESLRRLNSTEIREIERDILQQKQQDRLTSIEIQRQKSFDRSQSHSQFYKDFTLLENIWKGYKKNIHKYHNTPQKNQQKLEISYHKLCLEYQKFTRNYPTTEFHIYPDYNERILKVITDISQDISRETLITSN